MCLTKLTDLVTNIAYLERKPQTDEETHSDGEGLAVACVWVVLLSERHFYCVYSSGVVPGHYINVAVTPWTIKLNQSIMYFAK